MDLGFTTIYKNWGRIFPRHTINLGDVTFCDPWGISLVCLKAIENANKADKKLILPGVNEELTYLKRMHVGSFMSELTYTEFLKPLEVVEVNEYENPNVHAILHCSFRDEFQARLGSGIRMMFKNFGLNDDEEQFATALVGELGNNVFDHNAGSWPTDYSGAIIVGQHYPKLGQIEVAVADPGVGFLGSLKLVEPPPKSHIDAIQLGLRGVTGRLGERRGNGLLWIQQGTINRFSGILRIHSGDGLVVVDKSGPKVYNVSSIIGTIAELVIKT